MDPGKIRAAIETCRPGSDDLSLPEMAPLADALIADPALRRTFDRIVRLDRRIAAATRDVTVPAGLAERILTRLPVQRANADDARQSQNASIAPLPAASAAIASACEPTTAHSTANLASPTAQPIAGRRISRRGWSLAALAAGGIAIAAFVTMWHPHKPLSASDLVSNSSNWSAQLWQNAKWKSLPVGAGVSAKYPVSVAVRARPLHWADVSSIVGEDSVAYDVSIGGHPAVLFVIPSADPVADPAPPIHPQSTTGGQIIGCWQANGMIYVLVVEGDARTYENLVRPSAQPPFA